MGYRRRAAKDALMESIRQEAETLRLDKISKNSRMKVGARTAAKEAHPGQKRLSAARKKVSDKLVREAGMSSAEQKEVKIEVYTELLSDLEHRHQLNMADRSRLRATIAATDDVSDRAGLEAAIRNCEMNLEQIEFAHEHVAGLLDSIQGNRIARRAAARATGRARPRPRGGVGSRSRTPSRPKPKNPP